MPNRLNAVTRRVELSRNRGFRAHELHELNEIERILRENEDSPQQATGYLRQCGTSSYDENIWKPARLTPQQAAEYAHRYADQTYMLAMWNRELENRDR